MYDYHTHTSFSDDCGTSMFDMLDTAYRFGLKEIAITDHYDPDYPDKEFPFQIDAEAYHDALLLAEAKYNNKIKIIKGIEVGIQHGDTLKKCTAEVTSFPYDFVIGSFHCAEGYELYRSGFFKNRPIEEAYVAFYSYMYQCLKEYKDYDVLGHFNIIDRYSGQWPEPSVYMDIVEEILKLIISDGKGIEINTSSFRYNMGDRTTPAKEILQMYADLGGQMVTVGSDAHNTRDVGFNLGVAHQMISSVGIKYLTIFDNRKAELIKL